MTSPFQNPKLAAAIFEYWRARPISLPKQEALLCLKEYPHFRNFFSVVDLRTLYDSAISYDHTPAAMAELASELRVLRSQQGINSVSLRVGTDDPRGKVQAPESYDWKEIDEIGYADLTAGFDSYLKSRKSGYAEYYRRGEKRGLYQVTVHEQDTTKAELDAFISRLRDTYRDRGYSFKHTEDRGRTLFEALGSGTAILYSVAAKENPAVYADVYVFHNGNEAYYYLATRSSPVKGVLEGVAHFAQISLVRELAARNFKTYTLGFVGRYPGLPKSEAGVREFKRALSTGVKPMVHLVWESPSVRLFNKYILARKSLGGLKNRIRKPR